MKVGDTVVLDDGARVLVTDFEPVWDDCEVVDEIYDGITLNNAERRRGRPEGEPDRWFRAYQVTRVIRGA